LLNGKFANQSVDNLLYLRAMSRPRHKRQIGFPVAVAQAFRPEAFPCVLARNSAPYTQPRVSESLNGNIANKSLDKLLYYAGRLGIETKAKFAYTRKEVVGKELAMQDTGFPWRTGQRLEQSRRRVRF
jgi:hypothetical protein